MATSIGYVESDRIRYAIDQDLQLLLDRAGISNEDLEVLIEPDAEQALQAYVNTLKRMKEKRQQARRPRC